MEREATKLGASQEGASTGIREHTTGKGCNVIGQSGAKDYLPGRTGSGACPRLGTIHWRQDKKTPSSTKHPANKANNSARVRTVVMISAQYYEIFGTGKEIPQGRSVYDPDHPSGHFDPIWLYTLPTGRKAAVKQMGPSFVSPPPELGRRRSFGCVPTGGRGAEMGHRQVTRRGD
eukprot:GHVU01160575.1.p1 GENE.GHVU01160575.1~~GHVU01160575.1.p1  ORF type:complete len:175 (+),score=9.87 GHVU01160575.1:152-676(+)